MIQTKDTQAIKSKKFYWYGIRRIKTADSKIKLIRSRFWYIINILNFKIPNNIFYVGWGCLGLVRFGRGDKWNVYSLKYALHLSPTLNQPNQSGLLMCSRIGRHGKWRRNGDMRTAREKRNEVKSPWRVSVRCGECGCLRSRIPVAAVLRQRHKGCVSLLILIYLNGCGYICGWMLGRWKFLYIDDISPIYRRML